GTLRPRPGAVGLGVDLAGPPRGPARRPQAGAEDPEAGHREGRPGRPRHPQEPLATGRAPAAVPRPVRARGDRPRVRTEPEARDRPERRAEDDGTLPDPTGP